MHYCLGSVVTIMLVYQSLKCYFMGFLLFFLFACFVLSPECYTTDSWENLINVFFVLFFLHKVVLCSSCSTFAFGLAFER